MIKNIIRLLIIFPLAAIFITLAIANRHKVQLVLDPFSPSNPAVALEGPFFAYLFAALLFGIVLGGIGAWFGQGKWRRTARQRSYEAHEWRREAERLSKDLATQQTDNNNALPTLKS